MAAAPTPLNPGERLILSIPGNTAPAKHLTWATLAILAFSIGTWWLAMVWGPAGERVLTVFLISLIAVTGIGVYSGNSGILSFGHLAFMAIGAYSASLLTLPPRIKGATLPNLPDWLAAIELPLPAALVVAVLFTALIAGLIGIAIGRLEGAAATITTLGLLIIVHGIIIGWRDVTRGAQSFFGVPRDTDIALAAICCALALLAARLFRDSRPGLRLRAGRDNAIAARSAGIRIERDRWLAWILSACLMALAGGLLAHFLGAFSPKKFYFTDTFLLLAMLIVGGMYTVSGAVLGTMTLTLVIELLRRVESGGTFAGIDMPAVFGSTQIGIGLIILFAMFKKADGLTGFKEWEERVFRPRAITTHATTDLAARGTAATLSGQAISMRFGGLVAVNDVSISLAPGEILGLIGPNGSGKTTLLNTLSGVLAPSAGSVHFGGRDISGSSAETFARHGIARTFQNIRLFAELSARQNVLAAAVADPDRSLADAEALADAALSRLNLADKAHAVAGTLSYGDQRRVEIARALALRPAVLFLDEPAAGMNREETDALMTTLRELSSAQGIAILLVDHDLAFITALCSRVIVLNEGRLIAEGSPDEVKSSPQVIEAYLGKRASAATQTPTVTTDLAAGISPDPSPPRSPSS